MPNEKRLIYANDCYALFDEKYKATRKLINQGETHLDNLAEGFTEADRVIQEMPTVDAVEVVRCKDCKSFDEQYHVVGEETGAVYCGGYCYHWDYEPGSSPNRVDGDDFCSYGERRTDGS